MDFMHMFLSFSGRLRRMHFWIGLIILWVVEFIIMVALIGPAMAAAASGGGGPGPLAMVGYLLLLALLWPALALQVKRWHDRDKSWVWIFINFIPLVGAVWTLVECGFLDGTPGPNRFGPSPKGITAPATTATV
jgi:uncharacterized membrane protein YhaH (DUF805 family)